MFQLWRRCRHKWEEFKQLLADGKSDADALMSRFEALLLPTHVRGHLDLIEEVAPFSAARN